jgi:hypothetical protein
MTRYRWLLKWSLPCERRAADTGAKNTPGEIVLPRGCCVSIDNQYLDVNLQGNSYAKKLTLLEI